MGGLKRGSEDFRVVLHHFQTKQYIASSYDPDTIRNSNPEWKRKYDPVSFAESLRHIVATLFLSPPPSIKLTAPATPPRHNEC